METYGKRRNLCILRHTAHLSEGSKPQRPVTMWFRNASSSRRSRTSYRFRLERPAMGKSPATTRFSEMHSCGITVSLIIPSHARFVTGLTRD